MADLKHERYGLTDAEWAVAVILHEGCWCEPEQELYAEEGRTYGGCGPQSRGDDARRVVAAINGPEPGWAEVREAARNAGYRLSRRGRHHNDHVHAPMRKMTRWDLDPVADGAEARGGFTLHYSWWFNDGDEGSSLAVEIDLDDGSGTELLVWDATPEQALTAARLVGLGGDSDER